MGRVQIGRPLHGSSAAVCGESAVPRLWRHAHSGASQSASPMIAPAVRSL
ncbi:hypothetical protein [Halomonas urmiana]|nr:hypothetical protein [Halomonas urmiana]